MSTTYATAMRAVFSNSHNSKDGWLKSLGLCSTTLQMCVTYTQGLETLNSRWPKLWKARLLTN